MPKNGNNKTDETDVLRNDYIRDKKENDLQKNGKHD